MILMTPLLLAIGGLVILGLDWVKGLTLAQVVGLVLLTVAAALTW